MINEQQPGSASQPQDAVSQVSPQGPILETQQTGQAGGSNTPPLQYNPDSSTSNTTADSSVHFFWISRFSTQSADR